jgi:hypothetical protein
MAVPTATAGSPLKLRPFRRLLVAYGVNELGDWFGAIAIAILVLRATDSPLAVAVVLVIGKLAPALIAPALVARLESLPTGGVLASLYAAEAAVFVVLAVMVAHFSLPIVLALAFADGVIALVARSLARAAIVAVTKPRGMLRQGNELLNMCFTTSSAAGPALAGIVVALVGVKLALVLDAGSFLVAALALGIASGIPRRVAAAEPVSGRFRRGVDHVRGDATLCRLLVAEGAAATLFAIIIPVEVVYVTQTLQSTEAGYGLVLAAWGSGMVLGSAALPALRTVRLPILLAVSTAVMGVSYLGMGLSGTVATVALWSAVGGIANGVEGFALLTAVQERTADAFQARVSGLLESLHAAAPAVGFAAGGVLASTVSPRSAYLVAGAGALAVLGAAALSLRGASWGDEERPAAARLEAVHGSNA